MYRSEVNFTFFECPSVMNALTGERKPNIVLIYMITVSFIKFKRWHMRNKAPTLVSFSNYNVNQKQIFSVA